MKILWTVLAVGIVAPIWIIKAQDEQKSEKSPEQSRVAEKNKEDVENIDVTDDPLSGTATEKNLADEMKREK
jgi:hypothetical protein